MNRKDALRETMRQWRGRKDGDGSQLVADYLHFLGAKANVPPARDLTLKKAKDALGAPSEAPGYGAIVFTDGRLGIDLLYAALTFTEEGMAKVKAKKADPRWEL